MKFSAMSFLVAGVVPAALLIAILGPPRASALTHDLKGFNVGDQVIALGGIALGGTLQFLEFTQKYGERSEVVLAARLEKQKKPLERDAEIIYRQTFSEEELKSMSAFYQTKEGRSIARKLPFLYPKLAALGERYGTEALSTK